MTRLPRVITLACAFTVALLYLSKISNEINQLLINEIYFYDNEKEPTKAAINTIVRSQEEKNKKQKIVGFWHIGPSANPGGNPTTSRDELVLKQLDEIMDQHLFKEGLQTNNYDLVLKYVIDRNVELAKSTKSALAATGNMEEHLPTILKIDDPKRNYFEFPTLVELHAFCQNPDEHDTLVFYIHTKTKDDQRVAMEEYVLGKECLRCFDDPAKQACGPHYRKNWIWSHFSGNFWMTICSHVRTLNKPWEEHGFIIPGNKKGDLNQIGHLYYPAMGRFFAEYWLMNDAGVRPPIEEAIYWDDGKRGWDGDQSKEAKFGSSSQPALSDDQLCTNQIMFPDILDKEWGWF